MPGILRFGPTIIPRRLWQSSRGANVASSPRLVWLDLPPPARGRRRGRSDDRHWPASIAKALHTTPSSRP
ncbi:unnamed protein product [Parajaminaea phylloscopi]